MESDDDLPGQQKEINTQNKQLNEKPKLLISTPFIQPANFAKLNQNNPDAFKKSGLLGPGQIVGTLNKASVTGPPKIDSLINPQKVDRLTLFAGQVPSEGEKLGLASLRQLGNSHPTQANPKMNMSQVLDNIPQNKPSFPPSGIPGEPAEGLVGKMSITGQQTKSPQKNEGLLTPGYPAGEHMGRGAGGNISMTPVNKEGNNPKISIPPIIGISDLSRINKPLKEPPTIGVPKYPGQETANKPNPPSLSPSVKPNNDSVQLNDQLNPPKISVPLQSQIKVVPPVQSIGNSHSRSSSSQANNSLNSIPFQTQGISQPVPQEMPLNFPQTPQLNLFKAPQAINPQINMDPKTNSSPPKEDINLIDHTQGSAPSLAQNKPGQGAQFMKKSSFSSSDSSSQANPPVNTLVSNPKQPEHPSSENKIKVNPIIIPGNIPQVRHDFSQNSVPGGPLNILRNPQPAPQEVPQNPVKIPPNLCASPNIPKTSDVHPVMNNSSNPDPNKGSLNTAENPSAPSQKPITEPANSNILKNPEQFNKRFSVPVNSTLATNPAVPKKNDKLNQFIPKDKLPLNLKKFTTDEILQILGRILEKLKVSLDINSILEHKIEFRQKLEIFNQKGSMEAKDILQIFLSLDTCQKCKNNKEGSVTELRCSHIVCKDCLQESAQQLSSKNGFACPVCDLGLDKNEEARIWKFLGISKACYEISHLKAKLSEKGRLKCESCNKEKKTYYPCCYHICKECFSSIIRNRDVPCLICHDQTDYNEIVNEQVSCDDCGITRYFVGTYMKLIEDEEYTLCIDCTYNYYNTGVNSRFNLRLKKLERLEINDHLYMVCPLCKNEIFKENFTEKNCGHKVCNDHAEEELCNQCS